MVKKKRLGFKVIQGGSRECEKCLEIGVDQLLETVQLMDELPEILRSAINDDRVWQKRNENSIEKTLLSPGLASQWVAALLALGACVVFESGIEAPLSDFLLRRINEGKLISLSVPCNGSGMVYGNSTVRVLPTDEPIVSAYAVLDLKDGIVENARIALTGASREQAKLVDAAEKMVGRKLDGTLIEEIALAVVEEVSPKEDYRGGIEYRREMAGLMTKRALEMCMKGAK